MVHRKALTLKQLRALSAIVEAGSITAAARELHVTPPAVSTQLRALEDIVGARALERGPDGRVRLTPVGRELLATTNRIETALDLCIQRVTAIRTGLAGYLPVGVVSCGMHFAPGLVARLGRSHPDIEVGLKVGNHTEVLERMARGEIELALLGQPPQEPASAHDVLGPHPFVVIAAPEHPLAGRDRVEPEALLGETFLCREEGSGSRSLMTRYLERLAAGRPYRTSEMGTNETVKQAVMAGLGVALISGHTVGPELETGRLATLRLEGLPLLCSWCLLRPAEGGLSPVAAAFRRFVLELDGDYLPRLPGTQPA